MLESVYEEALCWELAQRGLRVERQIDVPIVYKRQTLAAPLRLDIRVEKLVIVEVKATTAYNTVFEAQALTYLRLLDLRLALVKDGIHRVVNKLKRNDAMAQRTPEVMTFASLLPGGFALGFP